MVIRDIYLLQQSDDFYIYPLQEVSVDLALEKAPVKPHTFLSGKVYGCNGPILGAIVKVFTSDYVPVLHTETNSDGRFVIKNVLPAGSYHVLATADGYKVSEDHIVSLESRKSVNIRIKLKSSDLIHYSTLYGIVRDEMGHKLSDVSIRLYNYECQNKIEAITQTNSDGEYLVYGLKPGKYLITAYKNGYTFNQPVTLECFPNEMLPLDLFLNEDYSLRNGTVSGRIEFNGSPVSYAAVALYRVEENRNTLIAIEEANDGGMYLFGNVHPGAYLVKAKLEDQTEIEYEANVSF